MKSRIVSLVVIISFLSLLISPCLASVTFSSSTPQIIAKGNDLIVKGTDATNGTVALWVVGRSYIDRRVIIPDIKGNYIHTISSEDTRQFASGQYSFVIQDSGPNRKLDVEYRIDDNGDILLQNQGKTFADIGARENLKASLVPLISAFSATANPSTDDIFSPYYFFVEEPSIGFDYTSASGEGRLPDAVAGNPVILGGPTNLAPHEVLHAEIRDRASGSLAASADFSVQPGPTVNRWSWTIDTPRLLPGTYDVSIWRPNAFVNSSGSAFFTVISSVPETTVTGNTTAAEFPWSHDPMLPFLILFALALVIASIIYTSRNR
jgi:hypothetical protein